MVVDMSLAEMFLFEILVGGVRVAQRRMIVLVLMRRTQMLEATGLIAAVVGHVEVLMGVDQLLVVVLLRFAHVWSPVLLTAPNLAPVVALRPFASSFNRARDSTLGAPSKPTGRALARRSHPCHTPRAATTRSD